MNASYQKVHRQAWLSYNQCSSHRRSKISLVKLAWILRNYHAAISRLDELVPACTSPLREVIFLDPWIVKDHFSRGINDFLQTNEVWVLLLDHLYQALDSAVPDLVEPDVPGDDPNHRLAGRTGSDEVNDFPLRVCLLGSLRICDGW